MRRSSVIGSQPPQHFVLELLRLLSQAEAPLLFVFLLSFSFFFSLCVQGQGRSYGSGKADSKNRVPQMGNEAKKKKA